MAKLKAPLLSLGATGQLGKTLVFFPWKGINAVREYVIPANPQTTLQTTQRDILKAGVAMVHTAQARAGNMLRSDDQVAYSALASAKGYIMTWFNMAIKLWVDVKVKAKTPVIYSWGYINDTSRDSIDLGIFFNEETALDLQNGKFYFGTSRTNLINSVAAAVAPGTNASLTDADLKAFLTAGVKYYWQFRPNSGDGCEKADSGIYYFVAT